MKKHILTLSIPMLFSVWTPLWAQVPPLVQKKITVPTSMRTSPFNVDQTVSIPEGFEISVYARIPSARFMATTPDGHLLVSVPSAGRVKLVKNVSGGDPVISDFVTGLDQPHDIVFHTIGSITYVYISEQDQINRYTYTNGDATGKSRQIVITNLPNASTPELNGAYAHGLKNIALDGNHNLYVSIASSCNACTSDTKSDPVRGAIYIYNADGTNGRLFARGIRNAEGLAFIPGTNTLWAVVNNRDNILYPYNDGSGNYGKTIASFVDDNPPEEFIRVEDGANYGWPFCNPDPRQGLDDMAFSNDYELNRDGANADCSKMTKINKGLQAHSAPLGLLFLQNTAFPVNFKNAAVVGLHGSWNRTKKTGYKVAYFPWNSTTQTPSDQIDLVRGFLNPDSSASFGRPVDLAVSPEGALLISDDQSGTIYKLAYTAITTGVEETTPLFSKGIHVFPQPASKNLQVKLTGFSQGNAKWSLGTVQGKELMGNTVSIGSGETSLQVNTETLTPGLYMLTVQYGSEKFVRRVVIE